MLLYSEIDMSQSYKKNCMYCNKQIEMSDKASGNCTRIMWTERHTIVEINHKGPRR
jgi:predicted nucleic acid-binding Zn ribbon protein